jgi:hypothetical protein
MNTKTLSDKTIGETYDRNRFEVHRRIWDDEKNEWGVWMCISRSAKTLEEAREHWTREQSFDRGLSRLIGQAKMEARIVKVTATCEVVE